MASASSAQLEAEIKNPSYATAVGLVKIYFEQLNQPEQEEEEIIEEIPGRPTNVTQKAKGPSFKDLLKRTVEVLMGTNEEQDSYPDEK
jgi:cell division ATPase FtsA